MLLLESHLCGPITLSGVNFQLSSPGREHEPGLMGTHGDIGHVDNSPWSSGKFAHLSGKITDAQQQIPSAGTASSAILVFEI